MRGLYAAAMLLLTFTCFGWQPEVESVRLSQAQNHARVVFDLSGPADHTLLSLQRPERVVVDIRNVRLGQAVTQPESVDPLVRGIRAAPRNRRDLRVVLDLREPVRPKSFLLTPTADYGHRLVVDLHARGGGEITGQRPIAKATLASPSKFRDVVIAIDAGHGGKDPGARGQGGTLEKHVVLAISRHLARMIGEQRGMRAVMVRRDDYYVGLRRRMQIARDANADLFISIHADAYRHARVTGSSVYVLSKNGASSEAAKWIADRENAADRVGGVSIDDKDDLLVSVLLDLSQTVTLSASVDAATHVLRELEKLGAPHKQQVQRAGFMVLKSPDIPSILVETGFISNPHEERKLGDQRHQRELARAMLRGIRSYLTQNPPVNTLLAARKHIIGEGDTLSQIAVRYQVSLDALRAANNLSGDDIHIGTVLHIPEAHGT